MSPATGAAKQKPAAKPRAKLAGKKRTAAEAEAEPQQQEQQVPSAAHAVFVKGLPTHLDVDAVRAFFAECGKVAECHLHRKNGDGKSRGRAIVKFATAAGEAAALAKDGTTVEGSVLVVQKQQVAAHAAPEPSTTVFVSNVPQSVTDDQLRAHFAGCGAIAALRRLPRRNAVLVQFETLQASAAAVAKNGSAVAEHQIHVQYDFHAGSTVNDPPKKQAQKAKKAAAAAAAGAEEDEDPAAAAPVAGKKAKKAKAAAKKAPAAAAATAEPEAEEAAPAAKVAKKPKAAAKKAPAAAAAPAEPEAEEAAPAPAATVAKKPKAAAKKAKAAADAEAAPPAKKRRLAPKAPKQ